MVFFFFKQKTAYEMRISDWSSDVCSSDLGGKKDAAKKCVCAAGCGSVFAGQQQRGEAAIPFGDDPKLQVARDLVGREQTILTGLQRGVVLPSIAVVQVAPIAMKMAAQVRRGDRKSTRLNSSH